MIPERTVAEVRALIASGQYTQRAIARLTGVSRGSVANIFHGRRKCKGMEEVEPPREWCPECGVEVVMPCVACQARADVAVHGRRPADPRPPEDDFQRHWTPDQKERLAGLRGEKERQGEPRPEKLEPHIRTVRDPREG